MTQRSGTARTFVFTFWPDEVILHAIKAFRKQPRSEVDVERAGALLQEAHRRRLSP